MSRIYDAEISNDLAVIGAAMAYASEPNTSAIESNILKLLHEEGKVTSDSLRKSLDKKGIEVSHSNAIGAAFMSLSKKGMIANYGMHIKSKLTTNHGRVIKVWELPQESSSTNLT